MNTAGDIDVIAIGNALVDVIAHHDDDFVAGFGLDKGTMHLIDEARAATLHGAMGPAIEVSGGAAANTAVGVASFGRVRALRGQGQGRLVGRGVRAPSALHGCRLRHATSGRWPSDGTLSDHGHARCAADDEHVPRCVGGAVPGRHRRSADRARQDSFPRGVSVRSTGRPGGFSGRVAHVACGRAEGCAQPVRPVLRRPSPAGVPRPGGASRGRALRERGRDLLAVRGGRLRRCAGAGSRVVCDRRVDPQRAWLSASLPARKFTSSTPFGSIPWWTRRVRATSTRPGSCTGSAAATISRPADRLGSLAAAEVISHVGARPATSLAELAASHRPPELGEPRSQTSRDEEVERLGREGLWRLLVLRVPQARGDAGRGALRRPRRRRGDRSPQCREGAGPGPDPELWGNVGLVPRPAGRPRRAPKLRGRGLQRDLHRYVVDPGRRPSTACASGRVGDDAGALDGIARLGVRLARRAIEEGGRANECAVAFAISE